MPQPALSHHALRSSKWGERQTLAWPTGPRARALTGREPERRPGEQPVAEWLKQAETELLQEMRESVEAIWMSQESALKRLFHQLADLQPERNAPSPYTSQTDDADQKPEALKAWPEGQLSRQSTTQNMVLARLKSRAFMSANPPLKKTRFEAAYDSIRKSTASLNEPEATGRLAAFVLSLRFEALTLSMIMLSAVTVMASADRDGRIATVDPARLVRESIYLKWDFYVELLCLSFFLVETVLRISVHKLSFFCTLDRAGDIMDFVTVIVSIVDMSLVVAGSGTSIGGSSMKYVRFLRGLLKMIRVLRIFRWMTSFVHPLQQILECALSSLPSIFWCAMLVVAVTMIAATFLVQCLTSFLKDGLPLEEVSPSMEEDLQLLRLAFGTVGAASFSLFEATTGGGWRQYYRALRLTGFLAPTALISYVLLFLIVAWNIVSSLFVEKMMSLSQPDADRRLMQKRQKDLKDAEDLLALLRQLGLDDDNSCSSVDSFKTIVEDPRINAFLESRDIDVIDALMFFEQIQLAASCENVKMETVANGLMRMRGVATCMDMYALTFQMNMMNSFQTESLNKARGELRGISGRISSFMKGRHPSDTAQDALHLKRIDGKLHALAEAVQMLERNVRLRTCACTLPEEAEPAEQPGRGLSKEEKRLVFNDIDSILHMPAVVEGLSGRRQQAECSSSDAATSTTSAAGAATSASSSPASRSCASTERPATGRP